MYRFAWRRAGESIAEDVASETFLVAWSRRDDFEGEGTARPWLLGIAAKLLSRHARLEARAWKSLRAHDLGAIVIDEFAAVDTRIDAERAARRLGRAIARLTTSDRDILTLLCFGDLTYAETASNLGIPIGTVRSRINRIRQKLQHAISSSPEREVDSGPVFHHQSDQK